MTDATPFDPKYVSLLWAGPDQAAEIATIHAQLSRRPGRKRGVRALLDHPASTAFIAMVGGAPKTCIGFVMAQLAADEAEILSIGVVKDWQRKGIGKRLIEGVARAAQRAEAKKRPLAARAHWTRNRQRNSSRTRQKVIYHETPHAIAEIQLKRLRSANLYRPACATQRRLQFNC